MNEKRFTIINMGLDGRLIKEDGKIIELERVVDLLNENAQLHKEIIDLKVYTEQLNSRIEHLKVKMDRERNATTKQHMKWDKEAQEKINELTEENQFLKQSNEDAKQILKKEFDFATEQRQKHLDDPVVVNAYDIIRYDMRRALDKLGGYDD